MSDVSCRVFGIAFDAVEARGLSAAELVRGLPYSEAQLREQGRRVEWAVMVQITERLEALVGGPSELRRIGHDHLRTDSYSRVRRLAGYFAGPRDLYWLGTKWWGPALFRITRDRIEMLPDGRILETIEIPERYSPCTALFHIIAGALEATPTLIGLPDSEVHSEIEPRRASFLIRPPEPTRSWRRSLMKLFALSFPREFVRELSEQQEELRRTNQALEETIEDLQETESRLTAILELDSDVRYAVRLHPDGRREQLWLRGGLSSVRQALTSHDLESCGLRVHPEDRDIFDHRFARAGGESVHRVHYRVRTEDKEQHWIQESIRLDRRSIPRPPNEVGSLLFNGTLKDVTARERTRVERDRLVSAIEQAEDGIVLVGPDSEVFYGNPAFHAILGRQAGSLKGLRLREQLASTVEQEAFASIVDQIHSKAIAWERIDLPTKAGPLILDASAAEVQGESGSREYYVGIVRDVTREVELEGQIRFAAHMGALGQLASGLVHDFNNLLMVIGTEGESIKTTGGDERLRLEAARRICEAAEQGAHLVRQLFTLSRLERERRQEIDVNQVVRDFSTFVRGALGPGIVISLELHDRPLRIEFGRGRLLQILVNLAFNARDAMPHGGRLTLASGERRLEGARAQRLGVEPGRHVWLSVSDSGMGMDAGIRARIFEPLFSTKELGRGGGMGLTTVLRSMEEAQGAIDVESERGEGSIFTLYFPAIGAES